jgi:hypothetical protein
MFQIKAVDEYQGKETLGVCIQEFLEEDLERYWRRYFWKRLPRWVSEVAFFERPTSA